MKVSVILSIYNRSKLLERGLQSIRWQTMPKGELEVLLVDDGSTEDLLKIIKKFPDLNIRHIKIDHTKHWLWSEMQKDPIKKKLKIPEYWFHTPALSINIGIKNSRGEVILITQPEVIHNPQSFVNGYNNATGGYAQIFAEIVMAADRFNTWLDNTPNWYDKDFKEIFDTCINSGKEYEFVPGEYYWFVEYIPRQAALDVNGVDEEYLRGVYGEDDNFRVRGRMAVRGEEYRGREGGRQALESCVVGIHQSHRDEKHLKQQREGSMWNIGANINRSRLNNFMKNPQKLANEGHIWGDPNCIKEIKEYLL